MRFNIDDRSIKYKDIFEDVPDYQIYGQVDISIVYPGTAVFWHRHQNQDDYQFVVKGALKIGLCNAPNSDHHISVSDFGNMSNKKYMLTEDWKIQREKHGLKFSWPEEDTCRWGVLSEHVAKDGPLHIPAGIWHGSYNFTNEIAILIYYTTKKFDKENPDEERADYKIMGWHWERQVI